MADAPLSKTCGIRGCTRDGFASLLMLDPPQILTVFCHVHFVEFCERMAAKVPEFEQIDLTPLGEGLVRAMEQRKQKEKPQ